MQEPQTRLRLLFLLCMLLFAFPSNVNASGKKFSTDMAMLNLSIGPVGIADDIEDPLQYGIEYRMRSFSQWEIIPSIGYEHTENGATFLYADICHEFWLADRWVVIPSFGLGIFGDSEELELGHELEFRTGIELAYRFHGDYRAGVAFFHLSNGGIGDQNPGTEALVVSLSVPL